MQREVGQVTFLTVVGKESTSERGRITLVDPPHTAGLPRSGTLKIAPKWESFG